MAYQQQQQQQQQQQPSQPPPPPPGSASGLQFLNSPFGDTTFTKVFVGGLAWETQSDTMRRYFEQFGDILEAVVITDKNTGRSKGYGFVTFRDPESARRACSDPTPIIDGRRANCNLASLGRPRPSLAFDKETLLLLEAVMHFGDDWKKVADRVTGKSDKECVARFIKLPFGDQFVDSPESSEMEHELCSKDSSFANKRMRFTPLADASNPIMAQAAFLSALVGVEVAEVAAHAAVTALSDYSAAKNKENLKSVSGGSEKQDPDVAVNGETANSTDGALVEAQLLLKKEEEDLESALSGIAAQTKELEDKIVHFEELDLQLGREWQQLQQLKDQLFVDQLTLLLHKAAAEKTGDSTMENVKVE